MLPIFISSIETDEQLHFFTEIYAKYYGMLLHEARQILKDKSLAEDMTHDAFLRAEKYISTIMDLDCCVLPSYLVSILKGVCYTYGTKQNTGISSRTISLDEFGEYISDPNVDVEAQVLRSIDINNLQKAMAQLPAIYRDILYFKYLLNMSNDTIGETLGIKGASVRQYLTRARRRCYEIAKNMEDEQI